eukprot:5850254-Prymnesium_polylepis.2
MNKPRTGALPSGGKFSRVMNKPPAVSKLIHRPATRVFPVMTEGATIVSRALGDGASAVTHTTTLA